MRHVAWHVPGLPQLLRHAERAQVLVRHEVPHPVLDEDVRWHVDGVRDGRNDLRVDVRGLERERRVHRIVERMDDVVHRARMVRVALEHVHRQCAGLDVHARRAIVDGARGAQDRQRIERLHLVVIRELLVEPLHRGHVGQAAVPRVAFAPELLDGSPGTPSLDGGRLGQTRRSIGPETRQHAARFFRVHL